MRNFALETLVLPIVVPTGLPGGMLPLDLPRWHYVYPTGEEDNAQLGAGEIVVLVRYWRDLVEYYESLMQAGECTPLEARLTIQCAENRLEYLEELLLNQAEQEKERVLGDEPPIKHLTLPAPIA